MDSKEKIIVRFDVHEIKKQVSDHYSLENSWRKIFSSLLASEKYRPLNLSEIKILKEGIKCSNSPVNKVPSNASIMAEFIRGKEDELLDIMLSAGVSPDIKDESDLLTGLLKDFKGRFVLKLLIDKGLSTKFLSHDEWQVLYPTSKEVIKKSQLQDIAEDLDIRGVLQINDHPVRTPSTEALRKYFWKAKKHNAIVTKDQSSKYAGYSELMVASTENNLKWVRDILYNDRADVKYHHKGKTALVIAAEKGYLRIVKQLINCGQLQDQMAEKALEIGSSDMAVYYTLKKHIGGFVQDDKKENVDITKKEALIGLRLDIGDILESKRGAYTKDELLNLWKLACIADDDAILKILYAACNYSLGEQIFDYWPIAQDMRKLVQICNLINEPLSFEDLSNSEIIEIVMGKEFKCGGTLLHQMVKIPNEYYRFHGQDRLELMKYILENDKYHIDINAQRKDGKTALMLASTAKDIDAAIFLINHGADDSLCDKSGRRASIFDSVEFIDREALLEKMIEGSETIEELLNTGKFIASSIAELKTSIYECREDVIKDKGQIARLHQSTKMMQSLIIEIEKKQDDFASKAEIRSGIEEITERLGWLEYGGKLHGTGISDLGDALEQLQSAVAQIDLAGDDVKNEDLGV